MVELGYLQSVTLEGIKIKNCSTRNITVERTDGGINIYFDKSSLMYPLNILRNGDIVNICEVEELSNSGEHYPESNIVYVQYKIKDASSLAIKENRVKQYIMHISKG